MERYQKRIFSGKRRIKQSLVENVIRTKQKNKEILVEVFEMKSKSEIIAEISQDKKFKDMFYNVAGTGVWSDIPDLMQEVWLILLSKDEKKIQELYYNNQLYFYTIRIVCSQYKSTSSHFHQKYRKIRQNCSTIDDFHSLIDQDAVESTSVVPEIMEVLSELNWYQQELFKIYMFEKKPDGTPQTLTSIAEDTHISVNEVFKTINLVKAYIKKRLNEKLK